MRGLILLIACSLYITSYSQEKIYGDFYLFQTKKEVKKIFKSNKDKYQNITFAGQKFRLQDNRLTFVTSFFYGSNKLKFLRFYSAKPTSSTELTQNAIRQLDTFFINNGYEVVEKQRFWDTPAFYDMQQKGSVYLDVKNERYVIMRLWYSSPAVFQIVLDVHKPVTYNSLFGQKIQTNNSDF